MKEIAKCLKEMIYCEKSPHQQIYLINEQHWIHTLKAAFRRDDERI